MSELRSKIAAKEEKKGFYPPGCSWNPMGEVPPQREDSYTEEDLKEEPETVYLDDSEEETDDQQNLREALSLLSRAKFWLHQQTKLMDARNLTLPDDGDWRVVVISQEITHFLNFFDKTGREESERERRLATISRKITALHPATMAGIRSHECIHTRHKWCPLVNCSCPCHKDEFQKTEEEKGREIAKKVIEKEEDKEKGAMSPL